MVRKSDFKVTTKLIVRNNKNQILILQNPPYVSHKMKWDLPGGTLETGEQFNSCIEREIEEELDVKINYSDLKLYNSYVVNRSKKLDLVIMVYITDIKLENFKLSKEHIGHTYLDKNNYQELYEDTPIFQILSDVLNNKKFT